MGSHGVFSRISSITVVLVAWIVFVGLAFFSNRGFNIIDEGAYLLSSRYPHDVFSSVTSFFYFTHLLFKAVAFDVASFRLVSLCIFFFSGLLAGWGVYRAALTFRCFSSSRLTWFLFLSLAGLGSLTHYIWGILSPGYNALMAWTVNFSVAILSFFFAEFRSRGEEHHIKGGILAFLQGCVVAVGLFAKITSGVALFCICGFWIFLTGRRDRSYIFRLFLFLSGMAAVFVLFFCFMEDAGIWYERFLHNAFFEAALTGHSLQTLITRHFFEFLMALFRSFQTFSFFYIGAGALSFLLWKRARIPALAAYIIFAGTLFFIIGNTIFFGFKLDLFEVYQNFFFMLILLAWIYWIDDFFCYREYKKDEVRVCPGDQDSLKWVYILILFVLPFVAASGTANPIVLNVLFCLLPWFGIYLFILGTMSSRIWPASFSGIMSVLICMSTLFYLISGGLVRPYAQSGSLFEKRSVVSLGSSGGDILLDSDTKKFIDDIKIIARDAGFRPGDYILAFIDLPGLVFALGGRSPGVPWYPGFSWGVEKIQNYHQFVLGLVGKDVLARSFVIQKVDDFLGVPDLSVAGLNFPEDYILCGETSFSSDRVAVRFWRPKLWQDRSL